MLLLFKGFCCLIKTTLFQAFITVKSACLQNRLELQWDFMV